MASKSWEAIWAYIKRRGSLLSMSLMYAFTGMPMQMWGSVAKHRDGVGYFSDPLGKPSLLTYWQTLFESTCGAVLLLSKRPADLALAAVEDSGDGVTVVDRGGFLEFTAAGQQQQKLENAGATDRPRVGVVILPGALVPPLAYAPLARTLARKGYPSYVVRFDFDLATDGWERIGEVIPRLTTTTEDNNAAAATAAAAATTEEKYGEADNCLVASSIPTKWVLVGHSMGTMAIEKWYPENSARVHGVVYMGSGTRIGDAMAGTGVPAMLVTGSRDPFTPPEDLEKAAHKLPKDTESVVVEGGNHRGFAHYTRQPLDWEATISPQEQQRIVVDAIVDFIGRRVVAGEPSRASTLT
eukprot:g3542.t1